MHASITFTIPGAPVGKGRPRAAKRGKHITLYTPAQTVSYENLVKVKAEEAMAGHPPSDAAVTVRIELFVTPPASWSKKKQEQALVGLLLPTTKPDIDNVIKGIFDAMNGIVWNDDKQACDLHVVKRYDTTARAIVRVRSL